MLMSWTGASAQFVPEGVLSRRGNGLRMDGVLLTNLEKEMVLSDIDGVNYLDLWDKYCTDRKRGTKQTIRGSAEVLGSVALLWGSVELFKVTGVSMATVVLMSASASNGSNEDRGLGENSLSAVIGGLLFLDTSVFGSGLWMACAGVGSLIRGITTLVVTGNKMNRIVHRYNDTHSTADDVIGQISLGPTGNGFGLSVTF